VQKLIADFKTLLSNNWKVIALIAIVVYLIFSYPDIKQGIIDGWFGS
jgi:hypothetical protein